MALSGTAPPAARHKTGKANTMEFLDAITASAANPSYIKGWAQGAVSTDAGGLLAATCAAAIGSVLGLMTSAFAETFWVLFFLWAADMVLGNLRALSDPAVPWSISRNLDGVLRLLVFVILGVTLVLSEELVHQGTGATMQGVLLNGGYAVCALAELRSLVKHFNYFIPSFGPFGLRLLRAVKDVATGNGHNGGGSDEQDAEP